MNRFVPSLVAGLSLAVVAPCAVLADTPIAKTAISEGLAVSAKFLPTPPRQGAETILITVRDSGGKPVRGASVKVASSMPTMSMGGPTVAARDQGNGTYVATTAINAATTWSFDIVVRAGTRKGAAHLSAEIK